MDGSLSDLKTVDIKAGAAVFFKNIGMDLGVEMSGLMFSTLTKLQAIALALKCVSLSCSIDLFLDSQAVLDACKLELNLVKGYSGVSGNKHVDELAKAIALSSWHLPHFINKCYLRVGGAAISDIDWFKSLLIWHPNSHMAAGFTSKQTAGFQTYFMKALYNQLPVAMCKQLYDKSYPSVVCLFCGDVEVLDHAFSCLFDADDYAWLLDTHALA
ncbi:hypothetical protein G9A89_012838 [Geosiphon pyriformis]|nr:hypothetical protein G9A89_012838 [Geosiphon pyriformis]